MSTRFSSVQMLQVRNSGMIFMGHGLFYTDMRPGTQMFCRIWNAGLAIQKKYLNFAILGQALVLLFLEVLEFQSG